MEKKRKDYTTLEASFLEALAGPCRGNIKEAMKVAGYSPNVATTVLIRQLKEEIIEIAQELLAAGAIKAAMSMDEILDSPNKLGAKNQIAAAKEILDRAGIVRPSESIDLKIPSGGLIILPAKGVKKAELETTEE